MQRILVTLLVLIHFLPGCRFMAGALSPGQETLTVFAAASLADAFSEAAGQFEQTNPGVKVVFNFAGSQSLRTQIEQGAYADVFASANMEEMETLAAGKFVSNGTPQVFLFNRLVVVMPAGNPANLRELKDLTAPGLKLVLAAEDVPVGKYSLEVLENLEPGMGPGFKQAVLENVASYENDTRQVLAKVQLGEADAGIVYSSDLAAVPGLLKIDIPEEYNVVAEYPLAVLTQSQRPALSEAFVGYILSDDGRAVLQKWGFQPVR